MDRIHRKMRRDAIRAEIDRAVAKALGESVGKHQVFIAGTGADHARLRGIPAIGRGVTGAIRGTDPERAVLDRIPEDK